MPRIRYRWNEATHKLEELGSDWMPTDASRPPVFTDRYMEGTVAPDGTDISNRTRRKNYMRANGVADASDFKNTTAKAQKERESYFTSGGDHRRRREAVERAFYQRFKP